jgi:hypothetical protein
MTVTQEQKIRAAFRDAGIPDYVGMELTAALPYLAAALPPRYDEPFRSLTFHVRVGDNQYRLHFEEE